MRLTFAKFDSSEVWVVMLFGLTDDSIQQAVEKGPDLFADILQADVFQNGRQD